MKVRRSGAVAASIIALALLLATLALGSDPVDVSTSDEPTVEVLEAVEAAPLPTPSLRTAPLSTPAINVMNGSSAGELGLDSLDDFDVAVPARLDSEIGGVVWSDTNTNGARDEGEPRIADVQVNLRNAEDAIVAQAVTSDQGTYTFRVPSGNYVVEFVAPAQATFTKRFAVRDESLDSDAHPDSGRSPVVAVGIGDADLTIGAGVIEFVGVAGIDIETLTEGMDADEAPGPELDVGSTATFTYLVRNTGNVGLTNIVVTDDKGVEVTCSPGDLVVGASKSCTASTTVTEGPYINVGSVVANPAGDASPASVTDSDPSNHVGVVPFVPAPGISIETATNGHDADEAPGPQLSIGDTATFTYTVQNSGNVDLVDVAISDEVLGEVCTVDRLIPQAVAECTADIEVTEGPYETTGSVSALAVTDDDAELDLVTSDDPSHHVGAPAGPACVASIHGPRMYSGGVVTDETGYTAVAGSSIVIFTSEPGGSPEQPNEQVYVQVGDDLYGPTPAELGTLEIVVENTGPVTILHHSVVMDDTSRSNSVEYDWCGSQLTQPVVHTCPDNLHGPLLYKGGFVTWDTELHAAPGSTISITTSEPGGSPGQPHEQVYLLVGDELFGPTPNEHTTTTVEVGAGGRVIVQHYSVIMDDSDRANSVEVELCGSGLNHSR